ncbi:hypothetical protein OBA37_01415 [Candidatus Pelagibacter sp.]|nr:hypothetical protein [Candidatus Pelagibacter sp.]
MEKELMPSKIKNILVMGAGGFIGGHLVKRLLNDKLKEILKWNYSIKLEDGIKKTYDWIYESLTNMSPVKVKFIKSNLK